MAEKRPNRWHALSPEETARAFGTDLYAGLSEKEARRRALRLRGRALWRVERQPLSRAVLGEFLDLAAILLILTAAVAAAFGQRGEAVGIAVILLVSAAIRTATGVAAQRVFERAARANLPRARVVRGGRYLSVCADEVVPGDVLCLSPGDTVAADARLVCGALDVSEQPVTERAEIVKKSAGEPLPENTPVSGRANIVFAASAVLRGSARAIVVAAGEGTYAYARGGVIETPCESDSRTLRALSGWCRTVSLSMILTIFIMMAVGLFGGRSRNPIELLYLSSLSLAVASMSEFLGVIAAIIYAVSMQGITAESSGAAVVKSPRVLEALGDAHTVVFASERLLQSGNLRLGMRRFGGEESEAADEGVRELLRLSALCCAQTALADGGAAAADALDALTARMRALLFPQDAPPSAERLDRRTADGVHTVLLREGEGQMVYAAGSLEDVLPLCSYELLSTGEAPISAQTRRLLTAAAELTRAHAVRTIAVAARPSPYLDLTRLNAVRMHMTLIGFVTVVDPVHSELAQYAARCRKGGVRLVVLSEREEAARTLCAEAGILRDGDGVWYADSPQIAALRSHDEAKNALIVCRTADDRARTLEKLRGDADGLVCVSDSLADVSAFSLSDVAVAAQRPEGDVPAAVGRRADVLIGWEENDAAPRRAAAEHALRMTEYARCARLNIRSAAEYLLFSQAIRLVLMLCAVFGLVPMLNSIQILLWGLLLDYGAVLSLAFRGPRQGILSLPRATGDLPQRPLEFLFPLAGGSLIALVFAALTVFAAGSGTPDADALRAAIGGGGVLASFAAAISAMHTVGVFSGDFRITTASLVYGILTLALYALSAWQALSGGVLWPLLAILILPGVLSLALCETHKKMKSASKTEKNG